MNPYTRRDFLATATAGVALAALNPATLSANPLWTKPLAVGSLCRKVASN